jgi:hypothetical protein
MPFFLLLQAGRRSLAQEFGDDVVVNAIPVWSYIPNEAPLRLVPSDQVETAIRTTNWNTHITRNLKLPCGMVAHRVWSMGGGPWTLVSGRYQLRISIHRPPDRTTTLSKSPGRKSCTPPPGFSTGGRGRSPGSSTTPRKK